MDGYQLLCEVTAIKKRKLSDEARKKLQDAGIIKPEAELGSQWTINTPKKSILKKSNLSKTKDKIVNSTSKLKNSTPKKLKHLKKFVKSLPK